MSGRAWRTCLVRVLVIATLTVAIPNRADAELVFLTSGRVLSVRAVQHDGDRLVLELRDGGQIVCANALVSRIEPDEIPHPIAAPALDDSAAAAAGTRDIDPPFGALIDGVAARHQVDPQLIRALVETESNFEPRARSPRGALGLMQLMPATARQYQVADPFDPEANLDAGIRHLKLLLARYALPLALAAYNAGEGAVARFGGMPPYRETQEYVRRILRRMGAGAAPGA